MADKSSTRLVPPPGPPGAKPEPTAGAKTIPAVAKAVPAGSKTCRQPIKPLAPKQPRSIDSNSRTKSNTDSQHSIDTKSDSNSDQNEPETAPLSDDNFVLAVLLRLLRAKTVDDCRTDRKTSESTEDGAPPSLADVRIAAREVFRLTDLATAVLLKEKSLLRIERATMPLLIVGDIHGQFLHLRSLFELFGGPGDTSVLFLGDYVDRGVQGVEVMCLLLGLKLRYPNRVFMLRGNHEDANTTLSYGFEDECKAKYHREGVNVWKAFVGVFNALPLAAIVNKKIFCVHGGLSPFMERVEDIEKIERPLLIPAYGLATDLVWADPDSRNPGWSLSHRGVSFVFDAAAVEEFCKRNAIDIIIRGHQISTDMLNTGHKHFAGGRMLTLFSAPNYLNYNNAGCVALVSKKMKIRMHVFRSVEEEGAEKTEKRKKESRKRTPAPVPVPIPKDKKEEPTSDPDTSTGSISEDEELSARDTDDPPKKSEKENNEKEKIEKKG